MTRTFPGRWFKSIPDDPFYQPRKPLWLRPEMATPPVLDERPPDGPIARRQALLINPFLGGLHIQSCPDEAALHADAIAIGDGVQLWPTILKDIETGALKRRYHATYESAYHQAASGTPGVVAIGGADPAAACGISEKAGGSRSLADRAGGAWKLPQFRARRGVAGWPGRPQNLGTPGLAAGRMIALNLSSVL